MAQILVNYNYDEKENKFTVSKQSKVYATLPIAVVDEDFDFENKEILVTNYNGVDTVFDKNEFLEQNELKHLVFEGNRVREATDEDKEYVKAYLPKDINLANLVYENGQLKQVDETAEVESKDQEDVNNEPKAASYTDSDVLDINDF